MKHTPIIIGLLLIGLASSAQQFDPPKYNLGCPTYTLEEYIRNTRI